jgi:hypothetical protein
VPDDAIRLADGVIDGVEGDGGSCVVVDDFGPRVKGSAERAPSGPRAACPRGHVRKPSDRVDRPRGHVERARWIDFGSPSHATMSEGRVVASR